MNHTAQITEKCIDGRWPRTNYEINFHIFNFSSCVCMRVCLAWMWNVRLPSTINSFLFDSFVRLTSDPTIFLQFSYRILFYSLCLCIKCTPSEEIEWDFFAGMLETVSTERRSRTESEYETRKKKTAHALTHRGRNLQSNRPSLRSQECFQSEKEKVIESSTLRCCLCQTALQCDERSDDDAKPNRKLVFIKQIKFTMAFESPWARIVVSWAAHNPHFTLACVTFECRKSILRRYFLRRWPISKRSRYLR